MMNNTAVLDRPTETEDQKLARGIAAILKARQDLLDGTLVCACDDPECITRRNKETA